MIESKNELNKALDILANSALNVVNDLRGITREKFVRKEVEYGRKAIEELAIKAAGDSLGLDIDGNLNTKSINDFVNRKLEGSGLVVTDIFNKRKTKADVQKFAVIKINGQLPAGLKFRSLARQDVNRGVKNYVKSAVKKAALKRAADLILDDDVEVAAMIAAYNEGRGVASGNKDATGAARQADFRANHVYGWVEK